MNYEDMSDFEINKAVARHLPIDWCWMDSTVYLDIDHTEVFDPCNAWKDAGPIIIDNDIELSIGRHGGFKTGSYISRGLWEREGNENYANIISFNKNPLRAAMICFLKMKDAGL
ncbi:NinX [Vibrio phage 1.105.O._10N.286.49.B4]|nr:NinX [Vibrio phage 1.105.O._10N.286.49.B4]